jgi:hypothetical protein
MWVFFLMAGTFLLIGILIHALKMEFLISGYNTMSKEQKEKVEIEKVGKAVGLYGYINAAVFAVMGILSYLNVNVQITYGLIFMAISTAYLIKYLRRFDHNEKSARSAKYSSFVTIAVIGVVAIMMLISSRPVGAVIGEEGLTIKGMYGDTYSWSEMENLQLLDQMPEVGMRTNGAAIGNRLTGHFNLKDSGSAKLFVDISKPPFLYFESNGKSIIWNGKDSIETQTIYGEILKNHDK